MSFASLGQYQTVSFSNLSNAVTNGVFQLVSSITSTNEQITKSDASTYVNINTTITSYSSKSSNQLVVKRDLVPNFQYSGTLYYVSGSDPMIGWSTSNNACSNYSGNLTRTAYWNGTLGVGTTVFTNANTIDGTNKYFVVYDGSNYQAIELTTYITIISQYPGGSIWGYYVNSITTCVVSYAFNFDSTSYSLAADACIFYSTNFTVYADTSSGISVTRFFTDSGLTSPFSGNGNYYSWENGVVNGTVDSAGYTNNVTYC